MNKLLIGLVSLAAVTTASANVTINLGVGTLYGSDLSSVFPDGGLVQLVVSTDDSIFGAVHAGSFVTGDDVVVASFSFDSSTTGMPGFSFAGLDIPYSTSSGVGVVGEGDAILLRWFPTLTLSTAAPAEGVTYGEFRTDALTSGSEISWILPSNSGGAYALNFGTISIGGDTPDIAAIANLTVTAVPEPSTYAAVMGSLVLGVVGYRRFRKR